MYTLTKALVHFDDVMIFCDHLILYLSLKLIEAFWSFFLQRIE